MMNKRTPLYYQVPSLSKLNVDYLATVNVLLNNDDSEESKHRNSFHTFDDQPDELIIKDTVIFCSRDINQCRSSCEPSVQDLKLKRRLTEFT